MNILPLISEVKNCSKFYLIYPNIGYYILDDTNFSVMYKLYNSRVTFATSSEFGVEAICLDQSKVVIRKNRYHCSSLQNYITSGKKEDINWSDSCRRKVLRLIFAKNKLCILGSSFFEIYSVKNVNSEICNYESERIFEKSCKIKIDSNSMKSVPFDVSVDSDIIAFSDEKGMVKIHSFNDKNRRFRIHCHNSEINLLRLSSTGSHLISSSIVGTVFRIYDISSSPATKIDEMRRGIRKCNLLSLSISNNSNLLSVLSDAKTLHLFRLKIRNDKKSKRREEEEEYGENMTSSSGLESPSDSWINSVKYYVPYFGYNWSRKKFKDFLVPRFCFFNSCDKLVVFEYPNFSEFQISLINPISSSIDVYMMKDNLIPQLDYFNAEINLSKLPEFKKHSTENKLPVTIVSKGIETRFLVYEMASLESFGKNLVDSQNSVKSSKEEEEKCYLSLEKQEKVYFYVLVKNDDIFSPCFVSQKLQFWKLYQIYCSKNSDPTLYLGFQLEEVNDNKTLITIHQRNNIGGAFPFRQVLEEMDCRYFEVVFGNEEKELYFVFGETVVLFEFNSLSWKYLCRSNVAASECGVSSSSGIEYSFLYSSIFKEPKEDEKKGGDFTTVICNPKFEEFQCCFDELQKKIYLFGGMIKDEENCCFSNLLVFSKDHSKWVEIKAAGDIPKPRKKSSLVYSQKLNQLVLFGGSSPKSKKEVFQDCFLFYIGMCLWKEVNISSIYIPSPRCSHCSCILNEVQFVVCGGRGDLSIELDCFSLDLEENKWKKIHFRIPDSPDLVFQFEEYLFLVKYIANMNQIKLYFLEYKKIGNIWKTCVIRKINGSGGISSLSSIGTIQKAIFCKPLNKVFLFSRGNVVEIIFG